jgi:hypothetical protein
VFNRQAKSPHIQYCFTPLSCYPPMSTLLIIPPTFSSHLQPYSNEIKTDYLDFQTSYHSFSLRLLLSIPQEQPTLTWNLTTFKIPRHFTYFMHYLMPHTFVCPAAEISTKYIHINIYIYILQTFRFSLAITVNFRVLRILHHLLHGA